MKAEAIFYAPGNKVYVEFLKLMKIFFRKWYEILISRLENDIILRRKYSADTWNLKWDSADS